MPDYGTRPCAVYLILLTCIAAWEEHLSIHFYSMCQHFRKDSLEFNRSNQFLDYAEDLILYLFEFMIHN